MILTEGINFINHFYESMISKSENWMKLRHWLQGLLEALLHDQHHQPICQQRCKQFVYNCLYSTH